MRVSQVELTALEPELKKKNEDVGKLLVRLQEDQKKADEVRTVVVKEEEVAKKKAAETEAIKEDAQRDLNEALPALQAATKVSFLYTVLQRCEWSPAVTCPPDCLCRYGCFISTTV